MSTPGLSHSDLVAAFGRDGYACAHGLLDAAAVRDLASYCDELQAWPEAPGKYMKYYEDSRLQPARRVLSRIENFCLYHPAFNALVHDRRLMGCVEALFGEPAVLFKDKINFKLPGSDGFKAHQDAQAGWDRYAAYYITALVSIDAATVGNGCLEMAAGRHRQGLIGRMWEPLSDAEVDPALYVPHPTAPGDVILFDSFAPHRSAPNMSAAPRRVLYLTYNRRSDGDHREHYYADKRMSYPPDCEREPGKNYAFKV